MLVTNGLTWKPHTHSGARPDELTKYMRGLFDINVIANIHLFNLFLPLILKGHAKKVIAISSGMADPAFVKDYDIAVGSLYATSKAALNMIVAKFSAQYKQDDVLFLALCPGMVDVGHYDNGTTIPACSEDWRFVC